MTDVVLKEDYEGVPEGSRFDGELVDGYYVGLWGSMWGTYQIEVPEERCEVFNEEKHDPIKWMFRQKDLKSRAEDIEGEIPFDVLMGDIHGIEDRQESRKSFCDFPSWADDRDVYQLNALQAYRLKHYPERKEDEGFGSRSWLRRRGGGKRTG